MASRTTCRSLRNSIIRARPTCEYASSISSRSPATRPLSSTASRSEVNWDADKSDRPRWSYTPEEMKAPFPWKLKNAKNKWESNSDPQKLDRFYVKLLGQGGDSVLTEEIKWLAITHKSFDQGRRGFNDRLAFFGRRILTLQINLAILNSSVGSQTQTPQSIRNPTDNRGPFHHPALEGLANLADAPIGEVLTKERLASLARTLGMPQIMRWTPRNPDKLEMSGIDVVLNTGLYAIIGAIALQRGGAYGGDVAREKILKPLGIL